MSRTEDRRSVGEVARNSMHFRTNTATGHAAQATATPSATTALTALPY
jgi:hypothetical protein